MVITSLPGKSQALKSSYAIQNVRTGQNLRPYEANPANDNKIVTYTHKVWKCMTWDFKYISDKTYNLQNQYTLKTFQTADIPAKAGTVLVQQVSDKTNQKWEFIQVSDNKYNIRLSETELYITSQGDEINTQVILQHKKQNDPFQIWRLIEQHPTN